MKTLYKNKNKFKFGLIFSTILLFAFFSCENVIDEKMGTYISVTGNLKDSVFNINVQNVNLILENRDTVIQVATDALGKFRFENLKSGKYLLKMPLVRSFYDHTIEEYTAIDSVNTDSLIWNISIPYYFHLTGKIRTYDSRDDDSLYIINNTKIKIHLDSTGLFSSFLKPGIGSILVFSSNPGYFKLSISYNQSISSELFIDTVIYNIENFMPLEKGNTWYYKEERGVVDIIYEYFTRTIIGDTIMPENGFKYSIIKETSVSETEKFLYQRLDLESKSIKQFAKSKPSGEYEIFKFYNDYFHLKKIKVFGRNSISFFNTIGTYNVSDDYYVQGIGYFRTYNNWGSEVNLVRANIGGIEYP